MTTSQLAVATDIDRLCVDTIRMLSIDALQQANSGHPGTPMALAPIGYVLFTRIMRHSPEHPDWPDHDRFVLSAQGIATSVGLALGERMLNARLGDDLIDHHTFCIVSDGDLQEGISSEACSLAGHLDLGRLIVFYDDNHISIEGPTSLAFSEDASDRYEAYGWHVHVLRDSYREPDPPQLILIATGSEVHICARAADLLAADGIATRVVSMPCVENFAAQARRYRDAVLPPECRARVSLEAASTNDWCRWVRYLGEAIGMESFGASGPAGALYGHFGRTPDRVADAGRTAVRRTHAQEGRR